MPKVALAKSLTDWESLITNASVHEGDDAVLAQNLAALREVLKHTREMDARRLRLEAARQVATSALNRDKEKGKKLAVRIRLSLKAIYTAQGPRLAGFGIKPRPLAKGEAPPEPHFQVPDEPGAPSKPE